jgi:hypothetical protein
MKLELYGSVLDARPKRILMDFFKSCDLIYFFVPFYK